ncbi:hypothetical protein Adu01nite_20620 [Paractinoplanes durhamensis]|uniref:Uncharacterized protein n=1 Tax=Paractinoplanes durhamensis TaxID=113563 RepID=A0ABQ3YT57_9ACTN|nr:hypothetical protein Adu01nite_20620 [Actinoplanes durhamensis]
MAKQNGMTCTSCPAVGSPTRRGLVDFRWELGVGLEIYKISREKRGEAGVGRGFVAARATRVGIPANTTLTIKATETPLTPRAAAPVAAYLHALLHPQLWVLLCPQPWVMRYPRTAYLRAPTRYLTTDRGARVEVSRAGRGEGGRPGGWGGQATDLIRVTRTEPSTVMTATTPNSTG